MGQCRAAGVSLCEGLFPPGREGKYTGLLPAPGL